MIIVENSITKINKIQKTRKIIDYPLILMCVGLFLVHHSLEYVLF